MDDRQEKIIELLKGIRQLLYVIAFILAATFGCLYHDGIIH